VAAVWVPLGGEIAWTAVSPHRRRTASAIGSGGCRGDLSARALPVLTLPGDIESAGGIAGPGPAGSGARADRRQATNWTTQQIAGGSEADADRDGRVMTERVTGGPVTGEQ
jgi:hypothetical protein